MAELAAPLAKRLCTAATAGSVKRIAIEGNIGKLTVCIHAAWLAPVMQALVH